MPTEQEPTPLEERKFMLDAEIRRREIGLKEADAKSSWLTAAHATIAGAVLALVSGIAGAYINARSSEDIATGNSMTSKQIEELKAKGNLELEKSKQLATEVLERKKFETSLIIEAIKTPSRSDAIRNLKFFVSAGFVADPDGKIANLKDENLPSIDVRSPGARSAGSLGGKLGVIAIGISDYGDTAKQLRLKFAGKDATDVASALLKTQSSVYSEVNPILLQDRAADKAGIFEAFASMERNMAKGDIGSNMAVIMFSGQGAIIDNQLYLLPYGVDAGTPARLKASAILASEFGAEISKIAKYGRVLLLLDACRSGMDTSDGSILPANADMLRNLMAQNNVSVLTSSMTDQLSREDEKWGHSAFTKILLEALGSAADANGNGMISVGELMIYIADKLPVLTDSDQNPGVEQRFQSDIFVAGE